MAKIIATVGCHAWILISLFCCVFAIEDYCSQNIYPLSNITGMQFTKEPSVREFAVSGSFKGLHCCVKGYRSIEWYKDGKPYPWPWMDSHLILYPESANQTIYTQEVKMTDSGNYTCLLKNDTVVHSHTIFLKVFENEPEDPQITYISQDMEVSVGGDVRLFCEAFAGHVDLPDALNEAVWEKIEVNSTMNENPRIRQEKIFRDEGRTFGTYLIINDVHAKDFGEYVCEIRIPAKTVELPVFLQEKIELVYMNPKPAPLGKIFLWLSVIAVIGFAAGIINLRFGLPTRVHLKDRFARTEEDDGKLNDALIVYNFKDEDIALGVILTTLEAQYNYKCASKELPASVNDWYSKLQSAAKHTRRIISIISPEALADHWNANMVYQALKQLQSLGPKMVCISLQRLPSSNEMKNAQGETLSSLVRSIPVIDWNSTRDDRFWLSLRLRLPPMRRSQTIVSSNTTQGENSTRLTTTCDQQEHSDELV